MVASIPPGHHAVGTLPVFTRRTATPWRPQAGTLDTVRTGLFRRVQTHPVIREHDSTIARNLHELLSRTASDGRPGVQYMVHDLAQLQLNIRAFQDASHELHSHRGTVAVQLWHTPVWKIVTRFKLSRRLADMDKRLAKIAQVLEPAVRLETTAQGVLSRTFRNSLRGAHDHFDFKGMCREIDHHRIAMTRHFNILDAAYIPGPVRRRGDCLTALNMITPSVSPIIMNFLMARALVRAVEKELLDTPASGALRSAEHVLRVIYFNTQAQTGELDVENRNYVGQATQVLLNRVLDALDAKQANFD